MSDRSFRVRRFEMSDVSGVVKLLKLAFVDSFSTEWWDWKYRLNPAGFWGGEGDIWIAENTSGEIIGHWAVLPEKIKFGSKTITVAQAVDAATHPDYRGCGIFRTLVRNVCLDAKNRYVFVLGFPNELYRGYEKLGWKSFRTIEFLNFIDYDRPLKSYFRRNITFTLAKTALKILRTTTYISTSFQLEKLTGCDIELEEVTTFPDEMNDFWKISRSEHEIILDRDSSFLNWRFHKHFGDYQKFIARSKETGEITGYMVVKRTNMRGIKDILDIVDLHALPCEDKSLIILIKFAIDIAKKGEFNIVHCRVPQWHKYAKFLRKLKFVSVGRTFEYVGLYQPRLIIYPLEQEVSPNMGKWFYTLADTDYA